MIKKTFLLITAVAVSFLFISAIPMLHVLFQKASGARDAKVIKPRKVDLFSKQQKEKKKRKIIKKIKPRKMERSTRKTRSRFQLDLSVSGPSDAAAIEKTELKVQAYEMGQTDTPPRLKRPVRPSFPIRAQEEEKEGSVKVRFLLDERGKVLQARILEEKPSGYGFGMKALEAVWKYQFEPARNQGVPVKIWVEQELEFNLNE